MSETRAIERLADDTTSIGELTEDELRVVYRTAEKALKRAIKDIRGHLDDGFQLSDIPKIASEVSEAVTESQVDFEQIQGLDKNDLVEVIMIVIDELDRRYELYENLLKRAGGWIKVVRVIPWLGKLVRRKYILKVIEDNLRRALGADEEEDED